MLYAELAAEAVSGQKGLLENSVHEPWNLMVDDDKRTTHSPRSCREELGKEKEWAGD